jgi:hypothetical protein
MPKKIIFVAIGILAVLPLAGQPGPPANSIVIRNQRDAEQPDRPFTISRVFAEGAFRGCVKAVVGGTVLPTQCDPLNRWPDGTLRHALISFRLTLPAGKAVTVEFITGEVNAAAGLSVESMLARRETNAQIRLSADSTTLTADVRQMLQEGAVRFWIRGPICTKAIVEDRNFRFDLGWDEHRSFHPIFVLTYYPGWAGVKVEMIGENAWTGKMQDLAYQLDLSTGPALERVHSKQVVHYAATRWRKVFWSGDEPGPVTVDHNLPYMVYSRALPSYDLSKKVSDNAVQAEIAEFNRGDKGDIPDGTARGRAEWTQYMPTTGGRGDLGVIARWYVRYLYRMDHPGMYKVMLGNGASSGHVPIHYRESSSGRCFEKSTTPCAEAFGRPVSIHGRPTYSVAVDAARAGTEPKDRVQAVGPVRCSEGYPLCTELFSKSPAANKWQPQLAHVPDMAYVPYLITGDWYFLEELQFWANYMLASLPRAHTVDWATPREWGYFNSGGYGGLTLEVRGKAWAFRTLVFAALAALDNTPEQAYYRNKVDSNIAVDEGRLNVTDGAFYEPCAAGAYDPAKTSRWCWGRKTAENGRANPLGFPAYNGGCRQVPDWLLNDNTDRSWDRCSAPWEINYLHTVWGVAEDMGFTQIRRVRHTAAKSLLHMIVDPEANPFLIAAYQMPILKRPNGDYFSSIGEIRSQFLAERACSGGSVKDQLRDKPGWSCPSEAGVTNPQHGYPFIAKAAASFLVGVEDEGLQGTAAWAWFRQNLDDRLQNDEPTWAFVPRPSYGRTSPDLPAGRRPQTSGK